MEKCRNTEKHTEAKTVRCRELFTAFGITALIARLFYRSIYALLLFFPIYYFYRKRCELRREEVQRKQLLREFRDCMEIIAGNLLAGYALENAFLDAEKEIRELHGEKGRLWKELEKINRRVCMNQPLEKVFEEFALECGVEEIRNFSEILSFAKRSGGNFIGIIQGTVRSISSKIQIEEEIQVMIAEKRLEQRIMNIMPLFLLFYLEMVSPGYLDVLYGNPFGILVMTLCFIGYAGAFRFAERVGRIEV